VIGEDVDKQLEPFNENIRMPRYVEYTRGELIKKGREKIENYKNGPYADFLKDPEKYEAKCKNPSHMKYIRDEFPEKLKWTDKEIYQEETKWYEPEDIGEEGEVYSTYNPKSKWDWYQVGGRWSGFFTLKSGKKGELGEKSWCNRGEEIEEDKADQAKKGDIDWEKMLSENFEKYSQKYDEFEKLLEEDPEKAKKDAYWEYGIENTGENFEEDWKPESREQYLLGSVPSTFAVLKDGEWYERGKMGWWAMVADEKEQGKWNEEFKKLIEELPDDTLLTVVDAHI
jgi:hypothetical protein